MEERRVNGRKGDPYLDELERRRLVWAPGHGGGAWYRRGELLVRYDEASRERLPPHLRRQEPRSVVREIALFEVDDVAETLTLVRRSGVEAQVNHVFFGCGPTSPAQSYSGAPAFSGPGYSSAPAFSGPGYMYSSVVAASEPGVWAPASKHVARRPRVAIVDTGLDTEPLGVAPRHPRLVGHVELVSPWLPTDQDRPDENGDDILDRDAGHGTFISGIVRRLAPDAVIHTAGVLSSFGDGDDFTLARGLDELAAASGELDLINMSLAGYTVDDEVPMAIGAVIAAVQAEGTVIVAAAGNDASCRITWPSGLPGVIAVGALDCSAPASFTNHGPWVDACAPGVDVLSTFLWFDGLETATPPVGGTDPDRYEGWAIWSGTSFAAPKVVAAIAREMTRSGCSAHEAAHRVVYQRGLFRIPDLGVVVNLV